MWTPHFPAAVAAPIWKLWSAYVSLYLITYFFQCLLHLCYTFHPSEVLSIFSYEKWPWRIPIVILKLSTVATVHKSDCVAPTYNVSLCLKRSILMPSVRFGDMLALYGCPLLYPDGRGTFLCHSDGITTSPEHRKPKKHKHVAVHINFFSFLPSAIFSLYHLASEE